MTLRPASSFEVFRPTPLARYGSAAVALALMIVAVVITADGSAPSGAPLLFWGLTLIFAIGVWRGAFVPCIALTETVIYIRNPVRRTAVSYGDVANVDVGYGGVTVIRRDGTVVTAWAVQKSNGARWLHQHTRGDDVVEAIRARLGPGATWSASI